MTKSVYPFHSESEKDYYAWIGLYVSSWAALETGIDRAVDAVYRFLDGVSIETRRPTALKAKLRFLRRALRKDDRLSRYHEALEKLLSLVEAESDFRHSIVHGAKINHLKVEPHYSVLKRETKGGIEKILSVSRADVERRYNEVGDLSMGIIALNNALIDIAEKSVEQRFGARDAEVD